MFVTDLEPEKKFIPLFKVELSIDIQTNIILKCWVLTMYSLFQQLLQLSIGSIHDHASALTCYLLALKMEAWLVLGYGIPHGNCAWVLSREYTADQDTPIYYIYDVVQNVKYNATDEWCSLLRVFCVVNGENVRY